MADDRMKNEDTQQNMGNREGQKDVGQQAPGRNPQDDRSTGAGQHGGQKDQRIPEQDDKPGASNPGGQNT